VDSSLRNALFKSPYGPTYYLGFIDNVGGEGVSFGAPAAIASAPQRDDRVLRRRRLSMGAAAIGVASLAGFATSLGLALRAKHEFDDTDLERRASQLQAQVARKCRHRFAVGRGRHCSVDPVALTYRDATGRASWQRDRPNAVLAWGRKGERDG
jgi:hypothetical protein